MEWSDFWMYKKRYVCTIFTTTRYLTKGGRDEIITQLTHFNIDGKDQLLIKKYVLGTDCSYSS